MLFFYDHFKIVVKLVVLFYQFYGVKEDSQVKVLIGSEAAFSEDLVAVFLNEVDEFHLESDFLEVYQEIGELIGLELGLLVHDEPEQEKGVAQNWVDMQFLGLQIQDVSTVS